MADGIYISMAGAAARSEQLDAISDALSNAQTPGYKKSEPAFQAFLTESKSKDQVFPAAVSTSFDLSEGATMKTEDKLDVVPNDSAFLAVGTPNGVAFTRAGKLTVDGDGLLRAAGMPVLDRGGAEIRVPSGKAPAEVHPDGTVYSGEERLGQLATFKLSGALERMGPQLMRPQAQGRADAVESGVRVGELELGNSSPLQCAVQLVSAQRHFETAMQSIQTYRKMDERTNELGRVR